MRTIAWSSLRVCFALCSCAFLLSACGDDQCQFQASDPELASGVEKSAGDGTFQDPQGGTAPLDGDQKACDFADRPEPTDVDPDDPDNPDGPVDPKAFR